MTASFIMLQQPGYVKELGKNSEQNPPTLEKPRRIGYPRKKIRKKYMYVTKPDLEFPPPQL